MTDGGKGGQAQGELVDAAVLEAHTAKLQQGLQGASRRMTLLGEESGSRQGVKPDQHEFVWYAVGTLRGCHNLRGVARGNTQAHGMPKDDITSLRSRRH